jgi:Zn-finger nucleic acid-binding protein
VSCDVPLVTARNQLCSYEACPRCAAVWIDEASFLALLSATPTAQHPDELMEHNDGSPRRNCPHCGRPMNLVWIDVIKLDRCGGHGVWLDPGEIEMALHSKGIVSQEDIKALLQRPNGKQSDAAPFFAFFC